MSRSQLRKQIYQTNKSDQQEWQSLVVLNWTNIFRSRTIISFLKFICGILNQGMANSFWNHVIQISSKQICFQDIYFNLWKVKIFNGNIYSLKTNTYFWGTVMFVQVGFLYLIVTRHKLTVWNKYDVCDQDQTGAPNDVMWKNNKSSWAGLELWPPASQFSTLTGPLELGTIKLHKAILGKDPSWGNKPW